MLLNNYSPTKLPDQKLIRERNTSGKHLEISPKPVLPISFKNPGQTAVDPDTLQIIFRELIKKPDTKQQFYMRTQYFYTHCVPAACLCGGGDTLALRLPRLISPDERSDELTGRKQMCNLQPISFSLCVTLHSCCRHRRELPYRSQKINTPR